MKRSTKLAITHHALCVCVAIVIFMWLFIIVATMEAS
jgi:hypothetical protein